MKPWYYGLCVIILGMAACDKKDAPLDAAQETAFFYLYNQTLISDTFSRMLYGDAIDFRAIDQEQQLMYFVFDKTLNREAAMLKIARDTSLIEFAPCDNGPCSFGGMEGNMDDMYALRMPLSNLKVDSSRTIPFIIKSHPDAMSISQMHEALREELYYGGKEYMIINATTYRNIGTIIMKKNKGSQLYKLAQKLKGKETKKEKIVQNVLDLVANEIDYSYADFWYNTEIMQRAHEVLLSGLADCSGKTVLMASLLEQLDISYTILYYKDHVNIGIEGDFLNDNGYEIPIQGKKYTIAETTCPKFEMGVTFLEMDIMPTIAYYQTPKQGGDIYNYHSEKKMKLYTEEEMDKKMRY